MKIICLLIFFQMSLSLSGQVTPLHNAHAHNDYLHVHPLYDALRNGFTSVEADIFIINGELYVSHEMPVPSDSILLSREYLDPLQKLLQTNHGTIYKNDTGIFYLMIDVKNSPEETYDTLRKQILARPEFINNTHFQIYLTGRDDLHFVLSDSNHFVAIDGKPDDLGKKYSSKQMPVVSESLKKISGWNGKDSLSQIEKLRISQFIVQVHADGKKCRLWEAPDNRSTWIFLMNYGVDFINTDKLDEFSAFMKEQRWGLRTMRPSNN